MLFTESYDFTLAYYDNLLCACLYNFSVHNWDSYASFCTDFLEYTLDDSPVFLNVLQFAINNYDSFNDFCLESEHQCHFDKSVLLKTLSDICD